MAKYKIADMIVEIKQKYKETAHWYEPYLYDGEEEPEFSFEVSQKNIDYYVTNGVDITPAIAENKVLGMNFNVCLLRHYGYFVHASALLYDEKVYLFSAASGVGKSTHTQKWVKRFGDRVKIINDDMPTFRFVDGKCMVYGTPFAGGTDMQINTSGELGALIFIERAEENSIEQISPSKSIKLLLSQSQQAINEQVAERQLKSFSMLLSSYPAYLLRCNMDDSAVDTVLEIINN